MRTVLAVDGGNSKTDVALLDEGGGLLAARRGPTTSHQAVGIEAGMARLAELIASVRADAGLSQDGGPIDIAAWALAGADTPADVRALGAALRSRGFARQDLLRNDPDAALRAGTDRGWGVIVICGQGVAAAGRAPDGRTARLAALGPISGDWGGGTDVGWAGIAAAVRARDGRGPTTTLAERVPAYFGVRTPAAMTNAFYRGRIDETRVAELSPVVFAAAAFGDAVAQTIVDRLADEVVAMAGAMIRRLRLGRLDPDVVLGGGVFRTEEAGFHDRIRSGVAGIAPAAHVVPLLVPPVAGAALLGLDALGVHGVGDVVRAALADWDRAERAAPAAGAR
jgi:N-acetylglucosamine kinase-like BadF-type ATPase